MTTLGGHDDAQPHTTPRIPSQIFGGAHSLSRDAVRVYDQPSQLSVWPPVYRDGGRLVIVADLHRPRKLRRAQRQAVWFGGFMGVMGILGGITAPRTMEISYWFLVAAVTVVVWLITHLVFVALAKSRLEIVFENGGFYWRLDEIEGYVAPWEIFEAAVTKHEGTQAELRRERNQQTPPAPVYQIASQVLVHSGFQKRERQTVAEIAEDEQGDKANLLKTAIEFVSEEQRNELINAPAHD